MIIRYFWVSENNGSLNIEKIDNCYIKANTDDYKRIYFATSTKYGYTKVFMFGPISDEDEKDGKVEWKIVSLPYKPSKIGSLLESFLNDRKAYKITQAQQISKEEFIEEYVNPMAIYLDFDGRRDEQGNNS